MKGIYRNRVHGHTAKGVMQDEEGLQCMHIIGCNISFLA